MLTLPYFLLLSTTIDKKIVSASLKVVVAIFAGIGFSIKPQFCIVYFLSELYFLIQAKRFAQLIRMESIIVISIFSIYLISTYLLYPAYFHLIIPQALEFYYQGADSVKIAPTQLPTFIFSILIILFYFIEFKNRHFKSLSNTLLVALIGFILVYLLQFNSWEYHFFPAYSLSLILAYVSASQFYFSENLNLLKKLSYITLLILFYIFYIHYGLGDGVSYYWITGLTILCLVSFLLKKGKLLSVISILLVIFFYPISTDYIGYINFKNQKKIYQPLINFIHTHAYHQSVYFLAATLDYEYPIVDYAGAKHVSRFPYLLWMPAYIKQMLKNPNDLDGLKQKKNYQYFMNLLIKDIDSKKPKFIFIDSSEKIGTIAFQVSGVKFLSLFLRTPEFKILWKNYRYLTTIDNEPYYRFEVYEVKE
jgi:hypothetical protein